MANRSAGPARRTWTACLDRSERTERDRPGDPALAASCRRRGGGVVVVIRSESARMVREVGEAGRAAMASSPRSGRPGTSPPIWPRASPVARMFTVALDALGRPARYPLPRRRDQRAAVRRRAAPRVLRRRLGRRDGGQRHGRLPHQPGRRPVMLRQPVDASGLRGTVVNMGSVLDCSPSPDYFGTIAYAASKGAVRVADARRRGAVRPGAHPLQPARPRPDRHPDGRPGRRRPGDPPYLATKQPMAGGPGTADDSPRPPSTSASRPPGSSPAPC